MEAKSFVDVEVGVDGVQRLNRPCCKEGRGLLQLVPVGCSLLGVAPVPDDDGQSLQMMLHGCGLQLTARSGQEQQEQLPIWGKVGDCEAHPGQGR